MAILWCALYRSPSLPIWRITGYGPRFIKLGRRILYPIAEVEGFEKGMLRGNTCDLSATHEDVDNIQN